jgi:hypothetical protein
MSKSAARISIASTQRLIGVQHADNGRSVAIAMVETDGIARIRRFHASVTPLRSRDAIADIARIVELVAEYLGNLMLQPFAIDRVGVMGPAAHQIGDALALHLDLDVLIVPKTRKVDQGRRHLTTSECVAMAAMLPV